MEAPLVGERDSGQDESDALASRLPSPAPMQKCNGSHRQQRHRSRFGNGGRCDLKLEIVCEVGRSEAGPTIAAEGL